MLIVSASIGGGHVAAARALQTAFGERQAEVTHVDLLDYTTLPFRRLYRQAYFDLVRTAPEFVDWLGKRLDRTPSEQKTQQEKLRARLSRLISIQLPRLISRYQPDVIVHTHFSAPEVLSSRLSPDLLRRTDHEPIPQVIVITDFFAHSFWLQPKVSRYFVASEEVAVHLRASGVPPEHVTVSGIPIDVRFNDLEPKPEARRALAYTPDRDVLLLMAGGLDERPLRTLITGLKTLRWPLTAVVVCGRSPELLEVVNHAVGEADGLVTFEVVGFTREVPRYMSAADLVVGKPGGLTSSEALAAGLPFAVVQPYPLQEEANTSYLLEHGAAMRIEPLSVLTYKVKRFFETPALRVSMADAARALGKPEAARVVADTVLADLETQASRGAGGS